MISFYIIFILSPLYLSYVPEWKNTDQKNKYTFPDNKLSKVYIYNTKRIAYTYYDSNNNSMISIDEQYNVPVPFEQIGLIGEKNGMYYICPKDPSKNLHIFFSSNQTIEEVELNSIFDNILHCLFSEGFGFFFGYFEDRFRVNKPSLGKFASCSK